MTTFQPGTSTSPSVAVELTVGCENLRDMDVMSRSDPMCVLFIRTRNNWLELGRTEEIKDCLNPSWQKKFPLDYRFEERQLLMFAIYDVDGPSSDLSTHDSLGSAECTLGEIVSGQGREGGFVRPLSVQGVACGQLRVHCEEVASNSSNVVVLMKLSGNGLDKKDWFGKSDPYLEIHRTATPPCLVYRSQVIKNTLEPAWPAFELSLATLCNGDRARSLKFTVWDWNSSGRPDLIGSFSTNLEKLEAGQLSYQLVNEKLAEKKGAKYKSSGTITFNTFQVERRPSFVEFITGGTQLNFTVAIDFTGSNGNPASPTSLHFRDPRGRPNQYVTAIQAVGEIIQDYDSDRQFPGLGFGARLPPDGRVSHEFYLNQHPSSPFCSGIEGLLEAYYTSLHSVQLYGPTNFSPVINHVARFAAAYQNDPTNYFVLLIITDGIISDMEDTKRAIIAASSLPVSIIIVGVGQEDFSAMEELDSDDKLLRCDSLTAKRDIVQFVELRMFLVPGPGGAPPYWSKDLLAKAVLAEVPKQLTDWMRSRGFQPRNQ